MRTTGLRAIRVAGSLVCRLWPGHLEPQPSLPSSPQCLSRSPELPDRHQSLQVPGPGRPEGVGPCGMHRPHRQEVGPCPSQGDKVLSLPIGTSPRHLPRPLPGRPPHPSCGLCQRGGSRGQQRTGEGSEGNCTPARVCVCKLHQLGWVRCWDAGRTQPHPFGFQREGVGECVSEHGEAGPPCVTGGPGPSWPGLGVQECP